MIRTRKFLNNIDEGLLAYFLTRPMDRETHHWTLQSASCSSAATCEGCDLWEDPLQWSCNGWSPSSKCYLNTTTAHCQVRNWKVCRENNKTKYPELCATHHQSLVFPPWPLPQRPLPLAWLWLSNDLTNTRFKNCFSPDRIPACSRCTCSRALSVVDQSFKISWRSRTAIGHLHDIQVHVLQCPCTSWWHSHFRTLRHLLFPGAGFARVDPKAHQLRTSWCIFIRYTSTTVHHRPDFLHRNAFLHHLLQSKAFIAIGCFDSLTSLQDKGAFTLCGILTRAHPLL